MDDLGINKWLKEHYGTTVDGLPLFRLIWSTKVTEFRHSKFCDYYGEILLREVVETREVLKYPFAQDRWVLERIHLKSNEMIEFGLRSDSRYSYEEIYIFQDKDGNFLPLKPDMVEAAMMLFFQFYLQMSTIERGNLAIERVAKKELEGKRKSRELIGDGRSPFGFVLE